MTFPSGPQLSVTYFPSSAYAGMPADGGFRDVTTGIADTDMDHGLAVCLGANGDQSIKLPGASGDLSSLKGFTLRRVMAEPRSPAFAAHDALDVMRVGRLWVAVQGDVVSEGPVYIIYSGTNAGLVRGDAGSGGNAAVLVTRCKVLEGATAGNLAKIAISLP